VVRIVTRADRGFRKVGGGVIEAFDAGRAAIDVDHDYIAKLDVDMEFGPHYLERILEQFARDPKLAAASGKVSGARRAASPRSSSSTRWSRPVQALPARRLREDRGFVQAVMWDGIDITACACTASGPRASPTGAAPDPSARDGSTDKSVYRAGCGGGAASGSWVELPLCGGERPLRMRERPYVVAAS